MAVLDVLLELLEGGGIGSGAVCLQDLDILIGQRCDLLLLGLIVGKLLLVLFPVLTRGAGHGGGLEVDDGCASRVTDEDEGGCRVASDREGGSERD